MWCWKSVDVVVVDVDVKVDVVVEVEVDVVVKVVEDNVDVVVEVEIDVVVEVVDDNVDVVVEVDVEITAESASGLLPSDFKTSPIGKIITQAMPPKSTNKNSTKITIRFRDHHDVFTIIRAGSAYSISV